MSERELKELKQIKRLLVLNLLVSKVRPESIAQVLDMDRGDFSREFPIRKLLKQKK